jgi:carbon-monoxide dehydrogenase large subunit
METRGVVARYDEIDDRLTVWSSTQTPHAGKRVLCDVLRLDESRLRVVTPDVGGGFGPKLVFYPEEALVALAGLRLKKPVKWIEDRREHAFATTQERDQFWDMELGLDDEGHILALNGVLIHEHGAYSARGVNVPYGSGAAITLPYVVPSFALDIQLALTNKIAVTPIRGAGQPQGVFAIERLLDQAAKRLGLDRAEIRRRNLVPPEKMPYKTPLRTRGGMQVVLDSGDYPACLEAALDKAGWDDFENRRRAALKEDRYIGIGLAPYVEGTGRGPFEPVSVRIAENGRIHVATGASAMGQSTKTMLAQIVAEQLGGDMDNVVVVTGDTAAIELGMGGFNSRQAVMAGSSAHAAAGKVRDKILQVASHMLDVGVQALEIVGRFVRIRGDATRQVSLGDISRALAGLPGYFVPGGLDPGLEATERVIINDMTYANGVAVVEVEVDANTGEVRVDHVVFAHDCGRTLHPKIVEGQIIGGIAHGIGNACFEWMRFDDSGQPLTTTLADYLLVSATEMPPKIDIVHLESATYLNELGIKGVGESGVIPMAAAIASAIDHALQSFDVTIRNVPVTPPDLVAQIERCAQP